MRAAAERLGVADAFVNLGPIAVADGPATYATCDALLLPTVLETFSANYPEAMALGLPIVTSDLDFAHDVCADAALYVPPRDPAAIAARIDDLLRDPALWNRLIDAGKARLPAFPRPDVRKDLYLDCVRRLLSTTPQA
ncbi:MAG: glycosyltransferase [Pirellulales bacterium]